MLSKYMFYQYNKNTGVIQIKNIETTILFPH